MRGSAWGLTIIMLGAMSASWGAALKLIPPPQQLALLSGRCELRGLTVRLAPQAAPADAFARQQLEEERKRALAGVGEGGGRPGIVWLGEIGTLANELKGEDLSALQQKGPEGYFLLVAPERIVVAGNDAAGTFYGVQTLKQLIRANRTGTTIPCCRIVDWPALRYRGYSDDISRGPIPRMEFFKRQIRTMAEFKMNMLTFYTEHVFKLRKHPKIAPPDGITAEEIRELSAYARQYHIELVGNFQSFGHFYNILRLPEYAPLRETMSVVCPVKEETYQFLDDVYSEIATAYDSPLFNVNCDETYGLGEGPSKELAAQIGVGGVYAQHMIRLHDILRNRYGKRMMMWGDIALQHPEIVERLPKDIIMLSWGYGAAPSYIRAIEPFVKAGFEFMVCPGVSCWSRIFPDYENAIVNIQNYVRDGYKLDALGMLNTTWDDDGENLFTWNFYGTNWGAACAWNPEGAKIEDYDAAYAAVSYGAPDDKITRAIKLLAGCVHNPLTDHNMDRAFWIRPFNALATTFETTKKQADDLCARTEEAMALLQQAKREATIDADDLDYLLFAARRLHYIGRSRQLWLAACRQTEQALEAFPDVRPLAGALEQAESVAQQLARAITELRTEYERLWLLENRPWWLKENIAKYEALRKDWETQANKIATARADLAAGKLPDAAALSLRIVETGRRNTRAQPTAEAILAPQAPWAIAELPYRLPIKLQFGAKAVTDFPVEISVNFGEITPDPASLRIVEYTAEGPLPCRMAQLIQLPDGKTNVAFLVPGESQPQQTRIFALYYGPPGTEAPPVEGPRVHAQLQDGWAQIDTGAAQMLVGAEGGHIYEWRVRALNDLEITQPGRSGWAGFCDAGPLDREAIYTWTLEAAGPVLARLHGVAQNGLTERIMTFYAGQPLVETMLSQPVGFYWDYDNVENFAADKTQPGTALFSDGYQEPVCRSDEQKHAARVNVYWGAKTRADGLTLANITPEVAATHMIGPGGGWGGVGIENSAPAAHFITFAERLEGDAAARAARLTAIQQTFDLRHQPQIWIGVPEKKP